MTLLDDIGKARTALSPSRQSMLAALVKPMSASGLADSLGLPRQRVGYHLKVLEQAGLVEPAGERQRRGFVEKLFVARSHSFVVDPNILGEASSAAAGAPDRHASQHLAAAAAAIVRDVSRMQSEAAREGKRLLTFTIEADVVFAQPDALDRFTDRLAASLHELASEFSAGADGGRRYRVTIGGRPAPKDALLIKKH